LYLIVLGKGFFIHVICLALWIASQARRPGISAVPSLLGIQALEPSTYGNGLKIILWFPSVATMNLSLPIRSASRRNDESRNHFTNYTPTSSTEAIEGPIREPAPLNDRLIVGLDFGTTYSG
jgi:hypothetical protein